MKMSGAMLADESAAANTSMPSRAARSLIRATSHPDIATGRSFGSVYTLRQSSTVRLDRKPEEQESQGLPGHWNRCPREKATYPHVHHIHFPVDQADSQRQPINSNKRSPLTLVVKFSSSAAGLLRKLLLLVKRST